MSSQQLDTHECCCKIQTTTCPCPICGNPGRKVTALTLDHHLSGPLREELGNDVTFCPNPRCDVVYCNPAGKVAKKGDTVLPVTAKDSGDDVFVCYCFEHKRGDLRRDLAEKGETDIPNKIRQGVKEGRCDCERKNPQGACCLGNVAKAVKKIQSELSSK
ncbi:MAG: (2Fe-2S)-binding protein [bacterium]|nr:(2Fe-2S)-binding protein [bacterium]